MQANNLKTHYSAQELLNFSLACLPNSVQGIIYQAKKNHWPARKKVGKGGGKEYALATLPQAIQDEIRNKFAVSVVKAKPRKTLPAKIQNIADLTTKQREIADARMALVAYVGELEQVQSRVKAINHLCNAAKSGDISEDLMALISVANSKSGNNCGRVLSPRTLNQWVIDYHKCKTAEERLRALAPGQRQAQKLEELAWLPDFLVAYRNTNGVNVTEAYSIFKAHWQAHYADQPLMLAMLPSLDRVRRGLSKLPRHIREIGRKTGASLRALNTYVKRDWSVLKANDVWVGDGHSMKMKVQHPDHGRPFIPELTLVMDAPSRFIVGWSVSLAENALAVADAIRNGIENHGIPAIYYSDNGGGEKNWTLDADITGILPRLGINHQTGIPGNPQGRGIIERVNQTLALRIARQFETYHGRGADRDTVRQTSTAVISLDKAIRQKRTELTNKQRWAVGKLPTWKQFIDAVEAGVHWYNNEHVHREIGCTPAQKRRELLADTELLLITPIEARDLFRPSVLRKAQRGWVSVFNNEYFSQKLLDVDGKSVQVAIDIHNPSAVIIRDESGAFICEAILDGNKRDAFPMSFVEKSRQERHQRRAKLKQEQLDEINAELNPAISITHDTGAELLHSLRTKQVSRFDDDEEIALLPSELRRHQQRKAVGAK